MGRVMGAVNDLLDSQVDRSLSIAADRPLLAFNGESLGQQQTTRLESEGSVGAGDERDTSFSGAHPWILALVDPPDGAPVVLPTAGDIRPKMPPARDVTSGHESAVTARGRGAAARTYEDRLLGDVRAWATLARRQVAGASPTSFLNARLKAASES
jgi:hypothetical protein